jgi:DNA-binding transcriptional ArsR family regulator
MLSLLILFFYGNIDKENGKEDEMKKSGNVSDTYKLLMNPTRLRILQTCMVLGEATTSQLAEELSDVAQATLYRQIKTLEKAGFLHPVKENRIRGTVEKVYALKKNPMGQGDSPEELGQILDVGLLDIMGAFHRYIKNENVDFAKDLYFMGMSTLMLSDEEMIAFTEKIGALINEAISNKPDGKRKARKITFISSPCDQE